MKNSRKARSQYIFNALSDGIALFGIFVTNKSTMPVAPAPQSSLISRTLADGNCAYNSIALFLYESFQSESDHCMRFVSTLYRQKEIRDYFNLPNIESEQKLNEIIAFFKMLNPDDIQRFLSPILRKMVVHEMRSERQHYQNLYGDALKNFLDNISLGEQAPEADTFWVHLFIQEKCIAIQQLYSANIEQQHRAIDEWWENEGYLKYLEVIEKPAYSAFDRTRWGGAPELNILGKIFQFQIRYTKNNAGFEVIGDTQVNAFCFLSLNAMHWSYQRLEARPYSELSMSLQI